MLKYINKTIKFSMWVIVYNKSLFFLQSVLLFHTSITLMPKGKRIVIRNVQPHSIA